MDYSWRYTVGNVERDHYYHHGPYDYYDPQAFLRWQLEETTREKDSSRCCCADVDIHRMLDEGSSEVFLFTIGHAKQCLHCVLCSCIAQGTEGPRYKDSSECYMRRLLATPDEFPQRIPINPYARILLTIRTYHLTCTDGTSIQSDVVGTRPVSAEQDGKSTIFRRPIGRIFDPHLLRNWLRDSDVRESSKGKAQCTRQIAPFEQILATGKFRVVDVIHGRIITFTEPVRFLALSYVWGRSMMHYAAATTHALNGNGEDTIQGCIDWSEVPATLRDAAELTKAIGERYIWIDSLCINQSNADEKGLLISQMASIFANAYLTIVAAGGKGADAGFSRLKDNLSAEEHPTLFTATGHPISLLPIKSGNRQAIMRSYWSSRGWTLQERLMSRRCVFFTDEQVYFQDADILVSEAYDIHIPEASTALRKHAHNNESFDIVGDLYFRIFEKKGLGPGQYDQAIKEYSKRTLSHIGDRFDAFMGVGEFFQPPGLPLDHITALNALPLKYFANALRWKHYTWNPAPKRIRMDARNSRYLPSWSWVGWDGEVAGPRHFDVFAHNATIIDSANILCTICKASSYFSPSLCEASSPAQVTIHLYAASVPCRLLGIDGTNEYHIGFNPTWLDCPKQLSDSVKLDEEPQDSWLFDLVLMGRELSNGRNDFWLVRVDQPFAERIAIVEAVWDKGDLDKYLAGNYFRVR